MITRRSLLSEHYTVIKLVVANGKNKTLTEKNKADGEAKN